MSVSSCSVEAALSFDSEHKRRAENLAFDIDVWYPRLKDFTFSTVFLPFTTREAHAVVRCYRERFQGHHGVLSEKDVICLRAFQRRVDEALTAPELSGGAFARLCGRSLKDADPLYPDRALREYDGQLQRMYSEGAAGSPEMQALLHTEWMKVTSGAELLSLLLSSERAVVDLKDWIQFGEPEQLVLRQWQPDLTQDMEFRIFVSKGILTGISQYEHYCHYPHLSLMAERLESMIVDFWSSFHPHVGVESYVADVGYLSGQERCILVELGPFLPCTGASCFRWAVDAQVLHHGPREFRLKPPEQALPVETAKELVELVVDNWRHPNPPFTDTLEHVMESRRSGFLFAPSRVFLGVGALTALGFSCHFVRRLQAFRWHSVFFAAAATPALVHLLWRRRFQGRKLLFVYGTLKSGFHWHHKFLSQGGAFAGMAQTAEHIPLVLGRCGVPYALLDRRGEAGSHSVRGELWWVTEEALAGLDDYEGITKGYYGRVDVQCRTGPASSRVVKAQIYGVVATESLWSAIELEALERYAEYTRSMHEKLYRPIEHILVKQQLYLANARRYNSLDDHVPPSSMS